MSIEELTAWFSDLKPRTRMDAHPLFVRPPPCSPIHPHTHAHMHMHMHMRARTHTLTHTPHSRTHARAHARTIPTVPAPAPAPARASISLSMRSACAWSSATNLSWKPCVRSQRGACSTPRATHGMQQRVAEANGCLHCLQACVARALSSANTRPDSRQSQPSNAVTRSTHRPRRRMRLQQRSECPGGLAALPLSSGLRAPRRWMGMGGLGYRCSAIVRCC
jgi:hypothetical protein